MEFCRLILLAVLLISSPSLQAGANSPSDQQSLPPELDPLLWYREFSAAIQPLPIPEGSSTDHCRNFYQTACAGLYQSSDQWPVTPLIHYYSDSTEFQNQKALMDDLLRQWKNLPPEEKVELKNYLANEAAARLGWTEKLPRWRRQLIEVKKDAIAFFEKHPAPRAPLAETVDMINQVFISDDYSIEPRLVFVPNVDPQTELVIGGGLLATLDSDAAVYYVLAHELGHIMDGKIRKTATGDSAYSCMEEQLDEKDLRGQLNTMEVEAEWFAHQLVALRLHRSRQSLKEKIEDLKNSVRLFCGYSARGSNHPSGPQRIHYFSHNPVIQEFLCPKKASVRSVKPPALTEDQFPLRCY